MQKHLPVWLITPSFIRNILILILELIIAEIVTDAINWPISKATKGSFGRSSITFKNHCQDLGDHKAQIPEDVFGQHESLQECATW